MPVMVRILTPMPEFSEKNFSKLKRKIIESSVKNPTSHIASIKPFSMLSESGLVMHGIGAFLFFLGSFFLYG